MQRIKATIILRDVTDSRLFERTLRLLPDVKQVVGCVKCLTATGARRKGKQWETQAAKELSLWISAGKDPHVFTRRSGSGGSGRDKRGFSGCCGDLQSDKPLGQQLLEWYCIELKFYEDLTDELWRFFTGQKAPTLAGFWKQACKAVIPYENRHPLLIVKINNRRPICFTSDARLGRRLRSYFNILGNDNVWCFAFDCFKELEPIIGRRGL